MASAILEAVSFFCFCDMNHFTLVSSKTGTMHNEAFPAASGKKLLFGHRAARATKPSGLSPGRRSKLVAGCRRNDAGWSFRHGGT